MVRIHFFAWGDWKISRGPQTSAHEAHEAHDVDLTMGTSSESIVGTPTKHDTRVAW